MGKELPYNFAKRHQVLLSWEEEDAVVNYAPHTTRTALLEAQRVAGTSTRFNLLDEDDFQLALTHYYQSKTHSSESLAADITDDLDLVSLADAIPQVEDLMEQEDEAPIIRLINGILTEAVKQNASDIHIETFDARMRIRFRVDGVLHEVLEPNRAMAPLLISRIKVMAKLDIAEKRIPQDGRISLKLAGREVDVRVSTLPSNSSERIVLRLLDKRQGRLDLTTLGMAKTDLTRFLELLHRPHGIILVTGPTGSGKTTTLYSGLQCIQQGETNILTIEDPVEYDLEGVGQTQVNTKSGMTFAKGLRAILRQDPDVVMVGEIRDLETAQIAIQASLTGHLVLSTLHTNTAIGAITRLKDMGVEPFLLASSVIGLISQRLVRVLCNYCKKAESPDSKERQILGLSHDDSHITINRPVGCPHCNGKGYSGRCGIYELIPVNKKLRDLIHNLASEEGLVQEARTFTTSILDDGIQKVLSGTTSLEEVLRVTQEA